MIAYYIIEAHGSAMVPSTPGIKSKLLIFARKLLAVTPNFKNDLKREPCIVHVG